MLVEGTCCCPFTGKGDFSTRASEQAQALGSVTHRQTPEQVGAAADFNKCCIDPKGATANSSVNSPREGCFKDALALVRKGFSLAACRLQLPRLWGAKPGGKGRRPKEPAGGDQSQGVAVACPFLAKVWSPALGPFFACSLGARRIPEGQGAPAPAARPRVRPLSVGREGRSVLSPPRAPAGGDVPAEAQGPRAVRAKGATLTRVHRAPVAPPARPGPWDPAGQTGSPPLATGSQTRRKSVLLSGSLCTAALPPPGPRSGPRRRRWRLSVRPIAGPRPGWRGVGCAADSPPPGRPSPPSAPRSAGVRLPPGLPPGPRPSAGLGWRLGGWGEGGGGALGSAAKGGGA